MAQSEYRATLLHALHLVHELANPFFWVSQSASFIILLDIT
jgi:hypothetical protein